jgi:hypothetical protein
MVAHFCSTAKSHRPDRFAVIGELVMFFAMRRSFLFLLFLAGATSVCAGTSNYLSFLDAFPSQIGGVPEGYAVAGEMNAGQRAAQTGAGRVVGQTTALKGSPALGNSYWPAIGSLFQGGARPDPAAVLGNVFTYGFTGSPYSPSAPNYGDFPAPSEATPTAAGGFAFWAQDFESHGLSDPGEAAQAYAAAMGVLWAARTWYDGHGGSSMKIIPVFDSWLLKSLDYDMDAALANLSGLGLQAIPKQADGSDYNFMSLLHHNGLIDGFIGEQYNLKTVGSFTADTAPFYDDPQGDVPYVILSARFNPEQVSADNPESSPPWTSHYDDGGGELPFQAGVYWFDQEIDAAGNAYIQSNLLPEFQIADELGFVVPEPSTYALLVLGAAGAGAPRARDRR